MQAGAQSNSQFSVQVIDGLSQPVSGVTVEAYREQKLTNGQEQRIELGKALSDTNGVAQGIYASSTIPTNGSFMVALSKEGYAGYDAGPQANYILKRRFEAGDLARMLKLPVEEQRSGLREVLAGEMDPAGPPLNELIFEQESDARPALRWLLDDPQVGAEAGELLAYLGYPEDVRLLLRYAPEPNGDPAVNRWAHAVACTLFEPASEREWSFLKRCASDNYGDHWVDAGAIRTLRLIASPRSLQILQDVRKLNPRRSNEVDQAVAYINSQPGPLSAKDATSAAEKLTQSLDAGTWMGNEPPRYDNQRQAALVDCNFLAGGSQFLVFTATLHLENGMWRVSGVRETRQTLLPKAPKQTESTGARDTLMWLVTRSGFGSRYTGLGINLVQSIAGGDAHAWIANLESMLKRGHGRRRLRAVSGQRHRGQALGRRTIIAQHFNEGRHLPRGIRPRLT